MPGIERPGPLPEAWAGIECTVNRVADRFFDQTELTGHHRRADDLERLAWLGVTAVRYPVLWERTAPGHPAAADWSWPDGRLARLRELGLRPIVGLVHHGSGPAHTSLVDPRFPEKLAAYARSVAERYPWVEDWTPINETVTTARFAGLYGIWYPHGRDIRTFARAVLDECRGVALAMAAIRAVNPRARLIQTEDVGRIGSTPALAYQADYENERRLLALDLLEGRVRPGHPLWAHLLEVGASEDELAWFAENPTPPDVIGLNYYLTSDRFLDHRLERYPELPPGGNGRDRYVDVEAVRVDEGGLVGHGALLRELWARYRRPLAITEVHAGCTREEQLRWLADAWRAAIEARAAGVDVRAVTAWSAFGAMDWDKLVVRVEGHYESGLFDLRAEAPRPTALAHLVRGMARDGRFDHPVLATPGWWRRPARVLHGPGRGERLDTAPAGGVPPVLVTGANGTLGRAFARLAAQRGLACTAVSRREMDIADPACVAATLDALAPWAVINAAGFVRVDDAEADPERCFRDNVAGPGVLAGACRARGIRLVTFSSDLVFDGSRREAYGESARPAPLNVYGQSKADAERVVLERLPGALVIRTAAFFGPWDEFNFVARALRALAAGRPWPAAHDLVVSPTYVPELVEATLDLLVDGERGVWHLANEGEITWAELARRSARLAGLDETLVCPRPARRLGFLAPRPPYSALTSERGRLLKGLDLALGAFVRERSIAAGLAGAPEDEACAS